MPRRASGSRHYKQNRLQQLRGFCHTARAGSVSKAAAQLMLSQPSVSLQIKALEDELNVSLFERRGPRIELTPEGELLYDLAGSLVEAMDSLQDMFDARRGKVGTGQLDIAAGESTILYLLPSFVHAFSREYPRIQLKLHNVTGQTGLAMLRAGDVDLVVGSMIEVPEDIEYFPLFTYDPMLITPRNHPLAKLTRLTMKDIAQHPLILPPGQQTTWRVVDAAFRQRGIAYQVRVEVGGWEVIKKYVELGLGVSVVTSICLSGNDKLHSIPVNRYFPKRTYGIVLRKGRFLSPQARAFLVKLAPGPQWNAMLQPPKR